MRPFLILCLLATTPSFARDASGVPDARLQCNPRDGSAQILASANEDDVHPRWAGGETVGATWTLVSNGRRIQSPGGPYLRGNLVSPRGDVTDRDVFIVEADWTCAPAPR